MAHVFGRASARFHFVAATAAKLHMYQAASPAAFVFGGSAGGDAFSLIPSVPTSLTLTVPSGASLTLTPLNG